MYVTKFVLLICAFSVLIGKSEGFDLWATIKKYLNIIYDAVTFKKQRLTGHLHKTGSDGLILTGHLHKVDSDEKFYELYNKVFDKKPNKNARNQHLVVQFSTPTCPPCIALTPHMEEYASRYKEVVFMKVDITKATKVAREYEVQSVPHTFFFKRKQVETNILGNQPDRIENQIKQFA